MEYKPDFEELKPYFQAFWNGEVLDRVALSVTAPRKGRVISESAGDWSNPKKVFQEKPERILDYFEDYCRNTFFGGLAAREIIQRSPLLFIRPRKRFRWFCKT